MRLTDYIIGVGRPVAYYPSLKKITGSTISGLLLCQFLYWTDKTKDGWIYKDSAQLEKETGLSYNEQRTAKKKLLENDLVESDYMRLNHVTRFRVKQEVLNALWEQVSGENTILIENKNQRQLRLDEAKNYKEENPVKEEPKEPEKPRDTKEDIAKKMAIAKQAVKEKAVLRHEVKGKPDFIAEAIGSDKAKEVNNKIKALAEIRELVESKLHINARNIRWTKFIEHAYKMYIKKEQDPAIFLNYIVRAGFDAQYVTPEKLITRYPQAYIEDKKNKPTDDFCETLPQPEDESEFITMPDDVRKRLLDNKKDL